MTKDRKRMPLGSLLAALIMTGTAHATIWLYPQDGTLEELSDLVTDGDTIFMTADAVSDGLNFGSTDERTVTVEANGHQIIGDSVAPLRINGSNNTVIVRDARLGLHENSDYSGVVETIGVDMSLTLDSCDVVGVGGTDNTVSCAAGNFTATNCTFENVGRVFLQNAGPLDSAMTFQDCTFARSDSDAYTIDVSHPTALHSLTLTNCEFGIEPPGPLSAIRLASGTNQLDGVFVENAGELSVISNGETTIANTTICAWSEDINLDLMLVGDWIDGGDVLLTFGDCTSPIPSTCMADLDGNGIVGFNDLTILLGAWGACR